MTEPQGEIPAPTFTDREREVMTLVAEGLPNKEIAAKMFLSEHTVKTYIALVRAKLGAAPRQWTRIQLVAEFRHSVGAGNARSQ